MALVTVNIKNNSGQSMGFTLDDEGDKERIEYLKKLVRREDLAEVKVAAIKPSSK